MTEAIRRRTLLAAGVLTTLCSAAMLVNQALASAGRLDSGVLGALFARADLAPAVLLATATFVLCHWRSMTRRSPLVPLLVLYAGWAVAMLFTIVALHRTTSWGRLLATAVFFRVPGTPVRGHSIGVLLLSIAIVAVLVVAYDRLTTLRSRLIAAGALVAVAFVARIAIVAGGRTSPFGPLSYLPAHLDAVAVGVAGAAFATALADGSLRTPARRRAWRLFAFGVAAVCLVVAAFGLGLDRAPFLLYDAADIHLRALAAFVFAAAVVAGVFVLRSDEPSPVDRLTLALAVVAPGILLVGEPAYIVVARQYVDRVVDGPQGLTFRGVLLPPIIWSLLIASAVGVLITMATLLAASRHTWRRLSTGWWFASITAFAFLVRVVALIGVATEKTDLGDPLFYHTTANMLANGRGYLEPLRWIAFGQENPSAFHGPLYPTVLSISSRIGGTTYFDHKMTSILIGSLLVLTVAYLGKRLAGRTVGVTAALIAAIYPNLWQIDTLMYPEGLMALLVLLTILVVYRWRDDPRARWAVLIGALIALAALARGEGILLGPLLVVPWMLLARELPLRHRLRDLTLTTVACLAVLAPWMIRNASSFEEFVPLSTNGNEVMVYANCPTAYSGVFAGYWDYQCQQKVRDEVGEPPGDESQTALYWRSLGFDYAREHASELPRVVALRVLRQWDLFRPIQNVRLSTIEGRDRDASAIALGMFYGLAALSIPGVIVLRRRKVRLLPLAIQFLSVTVTAAYTYGTVRFRAPVEPVLCVLGAVGLIAVVRRVTVRQPRDALVEDADPAAFVLGGVGGLRLRANGVWQRAAVRTWAALGGIAVLIAIPLRGLYQTTGGNMEEGFMLAFPERMLKGDLPNEDFLHLYGPGALHVLMGWYKVFGVTLEAERTFGLLQNVGIIVALFVLVRPWGRIAATGAAALSMVYVLTPNGLTAMAWNGAVALGLWSVIFALRARHSTNPRTARFCAVGAGLLAGLALTYRPDLALAFTLVYGWMLYHNPQWKRFVAGALIGLLPMWIHIALVGPGQAFTGMFIDPVFHLRGGRTLPVPPSIGHLDGSLQAVAELIPPWWGIPALSASASLFVWFFVMLGAAATLLGTAIWMRRRKDPTGPPTRSAVLMGAALFSVGIVPQALQRPDSTHLTWVTCVSIPLLVIPLIELARRYRPAWTNASKTIGACLALALMTLVVAPLFTYRYYLLHTRVSIGDVQKPFELERNGRRFYLGAFDAYSASKEMMADLDRLAKPGDRLLVGPEDLRRTWYSDAFFYYLYPELTPATVFIEMDPGIADKPGSQLAADVASADWVILTGFWNGWVEPNTSVDFGSDEPNQVIRDQFCEVGSYQNGLVRLMQRCRDA